MNLTRYKLDRTCIDPSDVDVFMQAADQQCGDHTARLYLALTVEEVGEMCEAEGYQQIGVVLQDMAKRMRDGHILPDGEPHFIKGFDGGIDTIWVAIGYLLARGMPIGDGWGEVARSNHSKIHADGTVKKDKSGKVVKPEWYSAPNLAAILDAHESMA